MFPVSHVCHMLKLHLQHLFTLVHTLSLAHSVALHLTKLSHTRLVVSACWHPIIWASHNIDIRSIPFWFSSLQHSIGVGNFDLSVTTFRTTCQATNRREERLSLWHHSTYYSLLCTVRTILSHHHVLYIPYILYTVRTMYIPCFPSWGFIFNICSHLLTHIVI